MHLEVSLNLKIKSLPSEISQFSNDGLRCFCIFCYVCNPVLHFASLYSLAPYLTFIDSGFQLFLKDDLTVVGLSGRYVMTFSLIACYFYNVKDYRGSAFGILSTSFYSLDIPEMMYVHIQDTQHAVYAFEKVMQAMLSTCNMVISEVFILKM